MASNKSEFIFAAVGPSFNSGSIDILTASKLLEAISTLFIAAESELFPSKQIQLRLEANDHGSFEFVLGVFDVFNSVSQLNLPATYIQASSVIGSSLGFNEMSLGLLDLLLFLKGESPKNIRETTKGIIVEGGNSGSITVDNRVFNFYESADVREALSEIVETLDDGEGKNSFEIRDVHSKRVLKRVGPEQLGYLAYSSDSNFEVTVETTTITVVKAIYEGSSKWRVKLEGKAIDAKILDIVWLKKFQDGIVQSPPRSKLKVVLRISVPVKKSEVIKYEILQVVSVIEPSFQRKFDL